ncbi:MAG: hypothetical protein MJ088_00385, partial [Clostridia bacterium]|nr:hypothetical protein [Clostridia bacterium]
SVYTAQSSDPHALAPGEPRGAAQPPQPPPSLRLSADSLYAELRDDASKQVAGTAMASSRNGSIMGDVMHWGIFTYESLWYDLTIDFAKLRAFLAR